MRYPIYETARANFKAARTRRAIGRVYDSDPRYAIAYVNEKLDKASRLEERRANFLAVFSE